MSAPSPDELEVSLAPNEAEGGLYRPAFKIHAPMWVVVHGRLERRLIEVPADINRVLDPGLSQALGRWWATLEVEGKPQCAELQGSVQELGAEMAKPPDDRRRERIEALLRVLRRAALAYDFLREFWPLICPFFPIPCP